MIWLKLSEALPNEYQYVLLAFEWGTAEGWMEKDILPIWKLSRSPSQRIVSPIYWAPLPSKKI